MSAPTYDSATAYHEAGHAVMALSLGRPIQRVSIEPNDLRLGHCEFKKGSFKPTHDLVETEMLILLAGLAAEARHTGQYAWDEASQDLRDVRQLAKQRSGGRSVERLERRMLDKTEYLLDQPGMWTAIERIAEELLRNPVLSGRAARHHFECALAEADRE